MSSDTLRLSGLNSGFDTEAMIEAMMSTYQTKIDNQTKKLTTLQWQQEAYRDITTKLTNFKNKYFDILNKNSYLMTPTAFSKFTSVITNKADPSRSTGLKVTTSTSAVEGNYKLTVSQAATATTRTGSTLQTPGFKLDIDRAIDTSEYTIEDNGDRTYNFALDVKVGDVTRTIEFSSTLASNGDGTFDDAAFKSDILNQINDQFQEEFGLTDKNDSSSWFIQAVDNGDGTFGFTTKGNVAAIITEKTGDFGLTTLSSRVAIAAQSAVTGTNALSVNVDGSVKTVQFEAVSSTYFDSREESGNGAILAEYNALKLAAYRKDNNLSANATVSQEALDNYAYTSTQAAKDKNSAIISEALNNAYASEGVNFTIDGSYITATKNGEAAELSLTSVSGGTFGLTKGSSTNYLTDSNTLKSLGIAANSDGEYSLTINGKEITVGADATISTLVSAVNASGAGVTMTYSKLENKFVITANDLGSGGDVKIDDNDSLASALGLVGAGSNYEIGDNAKITLNGVEIIHNSNTYTMDGITFDFSDAEIGTEIDVSVSKDYTDVKQTIRDFVNDYNQLIDDVYAYIGTAPKRDSSNNLYEPLTDDEKAEMSDDEIEKWEEAAKAGVLYNDSTVSSIMSQLRLCIYNTVEMDDGSKFGLFSMGIKTVSALNDTESSMRGKLTIDEDAFDQAFAQYPDAIAKLFTDPNTGVMKQISTVLDNAVSTTRLSGSIVKGSLIRKAGLESGTTATNNSIYKQMQEINERIATLQERYNTKEEYWWSVFTNLESMMADFNSQSNYLATYLGGFGNYV